MSRLLSECVDDYCVEMNRRGWRPRTKKRFASELVRFVRVVGDKPIDEVTLNDCRGFMDLFLERAPATFNLELGILNGFFAWLVDEEVVAVAPSAKIKRRKTVPLRYRKRTRITTEQLQQMLAAAETPTEVIGLHVLAYTGGRRNAVSELRWRDVDLKGGTITFPDAKGGKRHTVPIAPELKKVLVDHLMGNASIRPESFVVPNRRETGRLERCDRFLWHAVKDVAERCGIESHVHAFRAAFATQFLRSNPGCIEHARALLGHGSIETTAGYLADMSEDELKAVVESFSLVPERSLPRDLADAVAVSREVSRG